MRPHRADSIATPLGNLMGSFRGLALLHVTCSSGPSPAFPALINPLAHRNYSDFCDLRLRCPSRTPENSSDFRDFELRFKLDIFENPYGAPRPTESQNPSATKKEIPRNPKTPIIPKSTGSFPKSKRSFPKSKR